MLSSSLCRVRSLSTESLTAEITFSQIGHSFLTAL